MTQKIYTEMMIRVSALIGGPLGGFILLSQNSNVLGNKEESRKNLFLGIITTAVLFLAVAFIPEAVSKILPNWVIPLIYIGIIGAYANKTQGEGIKNFLATNGQKQSGWKVFGISVASLFITIIYFFTIIILLAFL